MREEQHPTLPSDINMMNDKKQEEMLIKSIKNFKLKLLKALIGVYIVNFICFFVAWIVGSVEMQTRYFEVLSYLIANDNNAKIIYAVWYGTYVILNIFLIYICIKNDMSVINNIGNQVYNETIHCSYKIKHKLYIVTTMLYIPVNILRLFGFFLLFNYNLNHFKTEHFVWTAIAMIGSIVCSVLLFIRRMSSRVYLFLHKTAYIIFIINAVIIILQIVFISLLPGAPDSTRGVFELLLAVFIGLDPIFQIVDLYNDYTCVTTINMHATYHKIHLTIPFVTKRITSNETAAANLKDETIYTITTSIKAEDVSTRNS